MPKLLMQGHTNQVNSVACSADGTRIVSGSGDSTVKVWDAGSGEEILTLRGHAGPVTSVAFSADGVWIASGSFDNTVKVWNAVTGRDALTLQGPCLSDALCQSYFGRFVQKVSQPALLPGFGLFHEQGIAEENLNSIRFSEELISSGK